VAKCYFCQADTELYSKGVPICLNCADQLVDRERELKDRERPTPPENPPKTL
jgi:hypothetical protein